VKTAMELLYRATVKTRRWTNRVLLLVAGLALTTPAAAQQVPTGYQEYFVIGHEQHLWDMMDRVCQSQTGGPCAAANGMNSVVATTASANSQIVYLDHWEDGYEANVFTPGQASTLIFGDGNLANGAACTYTNDPRLSPCNGNAVHDDTMFAGTSLLLASDNGLAPCGLPAIQCSVPIPRTAAAVRFDGGDFLKTSGGPISLVHHQDPLTQFIGGAVEMISHESVGGATSYSIPAGENLYLLAAPLGGIDGRMEPFHYVDLNLVAFEDGTTVFVNSPGAGTASFTLNKGQHWSSRGEIDLVAGPALTINSGTKISTNRPIAGLIFTGGDGNYANNHYALLPDALHGTDYVITGPGDNPAGGAGIPAAQRDRPANLYIFNPDPLNAITVTATDSLGTVNINIPANSVVDYRTGSGHFIPNGSTVRMTSNRSFWGMTAYDHRTHISDWGHSWLATKYLTTIYHVSYAPGNRNPAVDLPLLNPIFVSATQDNTRVQFDLNNDGTYDAVDTDGNGVANAAPLPNNTYLINALSALKAWDPADRDMTGARIVSNKPMAVAWGQDTETTQPGDVAQDSGYTVYPINEQFIDRVLTIDKNTNITAVSTAGGVVTYTLTIRTYDYGPLNNLTAYDRLPTGVPGSAYVPGSTLITYPNLAQGTADPTATVDPDGRARLTWSFTPNTMGANQTITVRYNVTIPAGPIGLLTNEAHARATYGVQVFEPSDQADVVRTDVTLNKGVVDDGTPESGEQITFNLIVRNTGVTNETNARISDAIPPNTTFVAGSITNAGPFTGTYSASQNAVVWTAANFTAGSGPFTLSFRVLINPGVPRGTIIPNRGGYESTQTPYFLSNPVQSVIVAPQLVISKTGGPSPLHPGEVATFEIQVDNVGDADATSVRIRDLFPTNSTYLPGSMTWRRNAGSFVSVTDAADADAGTSFVDRVELLIAVLGPGEDVAFRFQSRVNAGTAGLFLNNQANITSTETPSDDTNLVQIPIVGTAFLTGHVFLDLDGDGTQDPTEPNIPNVDVLVTDSTGVTQRATTDASGNYTVTVPPGSTSLNVDETDVDFPAGAQLSTANDPQTRTAITGSTVASAPVGYRPPALTLTKSSNPANHEVIPGQVISYTVTLRNNSGTPQTGVQLDDPLPTGTTYVAASAQVAVTNPVFRVTEYQVTNNGTAFTMTLNQNLAANYFVIVQGSDVNGTNDVAPNSNYLSLTDDPFATGDFGGAVAANQLAFTRGANVTNWTGVVTVVECLTNCATAGFQLRSVERVAHTNAGVAGTDTSAVAWTNINQTMLMGGFNGPGCDTAETAAGDTKVCHARIWPSGTNTINWSRDANGAASLTTATSTVMVVEWGSQWTVQRRRIQTDNGGDGVDATTEYATSAIAAVTRANTWVWGTGHTSDNGVGDAAEGVVLTLGNGVNVNATENVLAAGIESAGNDIDFEIYALTHADLAVDHRFKADGGTGSATFDVAVNFAAGNRMALSYNTSDGTGTTYPRPMFSARYNLSDRIRLERRRTGSDFAAWVQGINFSAIDTPVSTVAGHAPTGIVIPADGFTLGVGLTMTVTYQVRVDNPLAAGVTTVPNIATATTTQQPGGLTATVTETVVRPGVVVEYDNAGFTTSPSTLLYHHTVTNTGNRVDSYGITGSSELGWRIDLLDPDTGAILATDLTGDGVWDNGVVINTGTLAVGAAKEYDFRVTVPSGVTVGTEQTIRLFARSDRDNMVRDDATDETTILAAAGFGPIELLPDNSGVVTAGGSTVYTHSVRNNTGLTDTIDLRADSSQGWTATIYYDNDNNGVYTPGIDIAVNNTRQLANGESQVFFVVVDAPAGTAAGTVDVTHLTARSRNNANLFDGATDTTTVQAPSRHDLSGGGTREALPGDLAIFPGTVVNFATAPTRFDFGITPSSYFGLDALAHASQLWIDSDNNGVPDLQIAADTDGDGDWDTILGGYDVNGDNRPDVLINASSTFAYDLRRPIDTTQAPVREFVTLSAQSVTAGDADSVTATVLLAALSRATIRGLRVDPSGHIEFATGMQRGTKAFRLYEVPGRNRFRERSLLTEQPIAAPVPDSMTPILYEAQTRRLTQPYLLIEEIEVTDSRRWAGPFSITDARLRAAFERIEERLNRADASGNPFQGARMLSGKGLRRMGEQSRYERRYQQGRPARRMRRDADGGVKVDVTQGGLAYVRYADLEAAGLPEGAWETLRLTSFGQPIPFGRVYDRSRGRMILFQAEDRSTDYTGRNTYVFTIGSTPPAPTVPLTRSGASKPGNVTRVEKSFVYLANAPASADPWQWDALFADFGPWPYPWWGPELGQFDLPTLAPGASGDVTVRVRLLGHSAHDHRVDARINGTSIGGVTFSGKGPAVLTGTIRAEALRAAGNDISLDYTPSSTDPNLTNGSAVAYLDHVDLEIPTVPSTQSAVVSDPVPFNATLPELGDVQYLIVTHPLFREQADRLAVLKQSEGLNATVVEVDAAYDRFSGGIVEANAIRALIRQTAAASSQLKYVVLVGDTTFDPLDYTGFGSVSYVPSLMANDGEFGRVPSENLYADLDDDGSPDIAIGRLPVQTQEQADAVVDKIESQASVLAASAGRHLFAVDNDSDADSPFDLEAERMALRLPADSVGSFAEVKDGIDPARAALMTSWQNGVVAAHYFGHGGVEQWADEFLLSTDDVETLAAARPTVVFSWACETQWFMNLWGPSINEALVLAPGGGALASFGPAGITAPFAQRGLYEALYSTLGGGESTLGELIRRSKKAALAKDARMQPVVDGWNLLGDPALRLPSTAAKH
jgi:uncharacterized repeat protein (TIGR01451 family)